MGLIDRVGVCHGIPVTTDIIQSIINQTLKQPINYLQNSQQLRYHLKMCMNKYLTSANAVQGISFPNTPQYIFLITAPFMTCEKKQKTSVEIQLYKT